MNCKTGMSYTKQAFPKIRCHLYNLNRLFPGKCHAIRQSVHYRQYRGRVVITANVTIHSYLQSPNSVSDTVHVYEFPSLD